MSELLMSLGNVPDSSTVYRRLSGDQAREGSPPEAPLAIVPPVTMGMSQRALIGRGQVRRPWPTGKTGADQGDDEEAADEE